MKKVIFVGSEAYPFAKTGGLGDVMYALPRALIKEGVDARVIMPLYGCIKEEYRSQFEYVGFSTVGKRKIFKCAHKQRFFYVKCEIFM